MLWHRELTREEKKRLQRLTECEKRPFSTNEEYIGEIMGNVVSAYVELERRLPKEDGEAFYNALCLIENLLRKGYQDNTQDRTPRTADNARSSNRKTMKANKEK